MNNKKSYIETITKEVKASLDDYDDDDDVSKFSKGKKDKTSRTPV